MRRQARFSLRPFGGVFVEGSGPHWPCDRVVLVRSLSSRESVAGQERNRRAIPLHSVIAGERHAYGRRPDAESRPRVADGLRSHGPTSGRC